MTGVGQILVTETTGIDGRRPDFNFGKWVTRESDGIVCLCIESTTIWLCSS